MRHKTQAQYKEWTLNLSLCDHAYCLRISLLLWQRVNCIFWPIRTLNWLVAASKLHDRAPCCTAEWPGAHSLTVALQNPRAHGELSAELPGTSLLSQKL